MAGTTATDSERPGASQLSSLRTRCGSRGPWCYHHLDVLTLSAAALLSVVLAAPTDPAPFVVALDPGHGGTNLGALGLDPAVQEKHVVLAIAREIELALAGDPRVRLVSCRNRDELIPIRARVRCANQAHAELFVSVHANASPNRGSQEGFELYVLPVDRADEAAELAAARATRPADAAWALLRTRQLVERSLDSAKRIQWELADVRGKRRDRGIKQNWAALDVLQGLEMPGVLVEVGYLDHAEEGRELATPEVQRLIGRALARALSDLAARARRARTDPAITVRRGAAPPASRAARR